ncbi:MAG: acyltransferase [Bacteroidetes bacterium CG12_big_fil_rev_8_21_14_0_65_60_17]|nr:MAG: acyltransferase [Bacteroidetes bacterium CG12_big_fil_rev_8_21_14_0_65_60_17]
MTRPADTTSSGLRVALAQMAPSTSRSESMQRAVAAIEDAARQHARLVILPELFLSPYFCQTENPALFSLAEPVPGPATEELVRVARTHGISIVASLFEERAPGLYHNTAAVIDPTNGYLGKYRKMHIPDDPLYSEKFYFAPGDLGFKVFETAGLRVGVLICWDQWYPEAARLTALMGADLLVYPTAIGWHPYEKDSHGKAQHAAWETMQRSHAVANGCFVAAVNRFGFEPTAEGGSHPEGIEFWGQSFLAGPDGVIRQKAPVDAAAVLTVPLDLSEIREQRHGWPFFRDRRVDAYGDLSRRFLDRDTS